MISLLNTYLKDPLLEFIAPAHCAVCGKKLSPNQFLCVDCYKKIEFNEYPLILSEEMVYYYGMSRYSGVMEELIKKFKFNNYKVLASTFAKMLKDFTEQHNITFGAISYVPMNKKEFRERGYNQSQLLANALSSITGKPVINSIFKIKETKRQTHLSREERKENVKGAFVVKEKLDLDLLVLDDVYTTGSTAKEVVKAFRKVNSKKINFIALAQNIT